MFAGVLGMPYLSVVGLGLGRSVGVADLLGSWAGTGFVTAELAGSFQLPVLPLLPWLLGLEL